MPFNQIHCQQAKQRHKVFTNQAITIHKHKPNYKNRLSVYDTQHQSQTNSDCQFQNKKFEKSPTVFSNLHTMSSNLDQLKMSKLLIIIVRKLAKVELTHQNIRAISCLNSTIVKGGSILQLTHILYSYVIFLGLKK